MAILILFLSAIAVFAQAQPNTTVTQFPVEERLRYYVYRTYNWRRLAMLGVDAAVDHVFQDPYEWGRGPASLTYRYSSGFGRRVVQNSIELGAGLVFKEDTRFRQSQQRDFLKRLRFASTNALLAQDARGNRRFAYSRLAATALGILVTSTWRPCRRWDQHLAESIAFDYLGHLQNSLLAEFSPDLIQVGRKVRFRIFGKSAAQKLTPH